MSLKQALLECIPDAYYSDGRKAECMLFRICNMFDVDSQSFKEGREERNMDKKNKESNTVPVWGPEFNGRTGKLVQS